MELDGKNFTLPLYLPQECVSRVDSVSYINTVIVCGILYIFMALTGPLLEWLAKVISGDNKETNENCNQSTNHNGEQNEEQKESDWKSDMMKRSEYEEDVLDLVTKMGSKKEAEELLEFEKWRIKLIVCRASSPKDAWKKDLIKECESEWKAEILADIEERELVVSIAKIKEEWRINLIKQIPKSQYWKIALKEKETSKEFAMAIEKRED